MVFPNWVNLLSRANSPTGSCSVAMQQADRTTVPPMLKQAWQGLCSFRMCRCGYRESTQVVLGFFVGWLGGARR